MSELKYWTEDEITCKPLDTYSDILTFLQDPPSWRTLCTELKPHSKYAVKNIEVSKKIESNDSPHVFCHFDPETDDFDLQRYERVNLPKTLVCHDMANGYHDDSIVNGTGGYDQYIFYNWGSIDIFCYFSHHLITVPPVGWINIGHAHGVQVIGTVITEWAEGVEFWDTILESNATIQRFADALVIIAKTLKFDGWLLNIENKVTQPDKLLDFVQLLHKLLHQELEHAVLIWYDSVTVEGHLYWQNALNDKNRSFFDACDGMFTNYSWSEQDVAASAREAGSRLTDLFVGVDVWGRNFYGGGQFNTQEAIKVVNRYGCSLAIFAPAWTHEALNETTNDLSPITIMMLDKYDQFKLRDRALWNSIWPYLNTKLPSTLPFQTSFCRGQGKKRCMYGEVLCSTPWYNLRHMQYQPNSALGPHGYLLSTHANILHVSSHGFIKDQKGIIRYRESFRSSQLMLQHVDIEKLEVEPDVNEETGHKEERASAEVHHRPGSASGTGAPRAGREPGARHPKVSKSSVKKLLQQIFRARFRKGETDATRKANETSDPSPGPSAEAAHESPGHGKSLVDVSVNIRLGRSVEKTRYTVAYIPGELECFEQFYGDSFNGGSCLKINPSDDVDPEHRISRLFHCDLLCEDSLVACVVTKNLRTFEEQSLNVQLLVTEPGGARVTVTLVGRELPRAAAVRPGAAHASLYSYPTDRADRTAFRALQRYLLLAQPGFYVPTENVFGWKVRYYKIHLPGCHIRSINCRTGLAMGPILLGHLGLCQIPEDMDVKTLI